VRDVRPRVVVVDPISNMLGAGTAGEAQAMLLRLVDSLKLQQITTLLTSLTSAGDASLEQTGLGISSIIDTWILLRDIELGGERNRGMYVLKSRGMAHSNQIREFLLTDRGIELRDVYVGPEGVLTGSMRLAQEAREKAAALARRREAERTRREFGRRRSAIEAQIAALRGELEAIGEVADESVEELRLNEEQSEHDCASMARSRQADGKGTLGRGISTEGEVHGGRL